jgi:HK97 family phage prohead protease
MLADHDPRQRVGVWTMIEEDAKGLKVAGRLLTEKGNGKEAYIDLKAGALDGLSIGGRTTSDSYDGRKRARIIKEFELYEISLVSFPMNEGARVTSVKAAQEIKTIRQFEDFLRDAGGFSHTAAKAIAAGGFKASEPRDEDGPDIEAIKARFRAVHTA